MLLESFTTKSHASVVLVVRRTCLMPEVLAVTNRNYEGLTLPGGKREPAERARQCAARELLEETGMYCEPVDLVRVAEGENVHRSTMFVVNVYLARYAAGRPRNVERGTSFEWCTWPALLERSPFASFYTRHFPHGVDHLRSTIVSIP